MPYTPAASYNYTPMSLQEIQGQSAGQPNQASQFQDFAKWAMQNGIDLANLARTDRNTQLGVQNAFQQQQADRSYGMEQTNQTAMLRQQRLANEAAMRQENWSKSLSNPAVSGAMAQNFNARWSSPWAQQMLEENNIRNRPSQTTGFSGFGGLPQPIIYSGGSFIRGLRPHPGK